MRVEAVRDDATAENDRIGHGPTAHASRGKTRWKLPGAPQNDAQENARKIDNRRASLEETAEISKLAR